MAEVAVPHELFGRILDRIVLKERAGNRAPRVRFEAELEDHLSRHEAEQTLRVVTGCGRLRRDVHL